ncbi:MAG TPA: SCO family protein, partial [Roseateles sp.]|nr:SCO family protein [Roseateles sp.]
MSTRADASLRGTLLLCALLAAAALAAAAALTEGFAAWTFEELRRARAERGELRAPSALALRDSRGQDLRPWAEGSETIRIVDFIYARCPGICRALGSEYQQMQAWLREQRPNGVGLLSISFDIE